LSETDYLDMTGVNRLLDLGGGSGVVSLALLRQHPHLTSTVVGIANGCSAGREIAQENSLSDRITYQAADFVHDELPGGYDAEHCIPEDGFICTLSTVSTVLQHKQT
jgi:16S rRNA G1207 methylase RsmC